MFVSTLHSNTLYRLGLWQEYIPCFANKNVLLGKHGWYRRRQVVDLCSCEWNIWRPWLRQHALSALTRLSNYGNVISVARLQDYLFCLLLANSNITTEQILRDIYCKFYHALGSLLYMRYVKPFIMLLIMTCRS